MAGGTAHLKIGFVVDDTLDKPDGVQQYVLTLGAWLAAQGHQVHYLAGASQRRDLPHLHSLSRNIKVRYNGNRLSIPLLASHRRIQSLLRAEQFDVLHVQMPYSPLLAQKIIRAAPASTVIVGTFHILPYSTAVQRATGLLGWLLRGSLRRFDQVYAVSAAAQQFADRSFGRAGMPKAVVLPNVVDLATYRTALQSAGPVPAELPTVMFLGRLVPRKGCGTFLQAVAELRRQYNQPFRAVVCGKGPLLAELQAQARQLQIDDMTIFAGFIPEADKPAMLASARLVAYPSTSGESFGIVLLEAMAAGQAGTGPVVLAADNPGYHSVLAGRPELLFKPQDPQALANAMYRYMTDDAAADAARQWQAMYVQQFDVATVGRRLVSRYGALQRAKQSHR